MGVRAFRPDAPQPRAEVAARAAPAVCSDFAIRNADSHCAWRKLRAENSLGVADASDCEKVHRAASAVAVDGFLRPVFAHRAEVPPCTVCAGALLGSEPATRPDGIIRALRAWPRFAPPAMVPSARPANRAKGAFPAAFAAGQAAFPCSPERRRHACHCRRSTLGPRRLGPANPRRERPSPLRSRSGLQSPLARGVQADDSASCIEDASDSGHGLAESLSAFLHAPSPLHPGLTPDPVPRAVPPLGAAASSVRSWRDECSASYGKAQRAAAATAACATSVSARSVLLTRGRSKAQSRSRSH